MVKVVFSSRTKDDLFTLSNIQAMCKLEGKYITSSSIYQRNCIKQNDKKTCCRPLSLGNYIALVTGKPNCTMITEADINSMKSTITECVGFYQNYSLNMDCDKRHSPHGFSNTVCRGIPGRCRKFNAVYNIMHFITDRSFQRSSAKLNMAMSFLPISFQLTTSQKLDDAIELFLQVESSKSEPGNVDIVAADFGIKDHLFHFYLSKDSKWIIVSGVFIFFIIWIFTGSIFITIMTFITLFWSIELAYFLYSSVFEIAFFPYMNVVTILMAIAIGADDVFIYTKIWHLAKKERNCGTLEKLVSDTLKHAALSMVVTSMTTAGALYANIVSSITSVKCFSIYAGTTMLCNLVLMVTWMPASIVVMEKWCNFCFINSPKFYKKIHDHYRSFFERILPDAVLKLTYIWVILLGAIGIVSGVIIFEYPKLRLPTSFHFQVFRGEHLMEIYDREMRRNFHFETAREFGKPLMPLTFVWGIQDKDNGDSLNPHDKGQLQYDLSFNPGTHNAQLWLRKFCRDLRETKFYKKVATFEMTNCYIEYFIQYMRAACNEKEKLCCRNSVFPYSETVFNICVRQYLQLSSKHNVYLLDNQSPGLKYKHNRISALVVQFSSNMTYTYEYETMKDFYEYINKWFAEQLETAPREMQNGWFVSELKFYSIQKSLAEGLPVAFGISVLVATIVTFVTSLNILITLYAMLTILCIMLVTTAAIVLMGWELNIFESVVITVAVGLSIDHTLHYGVAYRLAPDLDRHNRTYCSLVRVGNVIFIAGLSTFLAGVFMLPSVTLVYQKFGIFLVLVMAISWFYSTFFFLSLLNLFGPQGGFGQFHWPSLDCCSFLPQTHTDRTVYTMSESTMSTSSSGYPYHPSIDTNATEHDYVSERPGDSNPGTPYHYRQRPGRYYSRPKSESMSPDNQSHRKLLTGEDSAGNDGKLTVEVHDTTQHNTEKLCTEV